MCMFLAYKKYIETNTIKNSIMHNTYYRFLSKVKLSPFPSFNCSNNKLVKTYGEWTLQNEVISLSDMKQTAIHTRHLTDMYRTL